MKEIKGGVTAAKGFQAASAAAEIKYKGRTDMAMIFSSVPCKAAGDLYYEHSEGSSCKMGSEGSV